MCLILGHVCGKIEVMEMTLKASDPLEEEMDRLIPMINRNQSKK